MKKILICLLSVLLFAGCVTASYSNFNCELHNESNEPVERDKVIGIAVSRDGSSFENDVYVGSGLTLSNIIMQEAESYCSKVVIFEKNSVIGDFSKEELASCDYIIVPKILLWEAKLAAYSITADAAEVNLEIYNSNKELLRTGSVSGKSSTTNGPAEIMASQLNTFFDTLFN